MSDYVRNGYVIFVNSDLYKNNIDGIRDEVEGIKSRYFQKEDEQKNKVLPEACQQLIQILQKAKEVQQNKEVQYLQKRLQLIEKDDIVDEVRRQALENALNEIEKGSGDLLTAFNLENNSAERLQQLKTEASNLTRTKPVMDSTAKKSEKVIEQSITKVLERKIQEQINDNMVSEWFLKGDISFEEIFDQVVQDLVQGELPQATRQSFLDYAKNIEGGVINLLKKNGFELKRGGLFQSEGKTLSDTEIFRVATGKKKGITAQDIAKAIAPQVSSSINGGTFEIVTVGQHQNAKGRVIAIGLGKMLEKQRHIIQERLEKAGKSKSQIKNDQLRLEINLPTDSLQELEKNITEWLAKNSDELYVDFQQKFDQFLLEQIKKENITGPVFDKIVYNIKGYGSTRPGRYYTIGENVSFDSAATRLLNISSDISGQGQLSGEELLFILSNTTPPGAFKDNQDDVQNYLAAVSAAWVWNDEDQLFKEIESRGIPSSFRKIRLFQAGEMLVPASVIIQQSIDLLQRIIQDSKQYTSNLVKVSIKPYQNLMKDYKNLQGQPDAWYLIRNLALSNGKISFKFNRNQIEKLLSDFKKVLNTKTFIEQPQ